MINGTPAAFTIAWHDARDHRDGDDDAWVVGPAAAWALTGTPLATCVARVLPDDSARAMFASPRRFDCRRTQPSFGPGDCWVMAAHLPVLQGGGINLRTASVWQGGATLYVRYAHGVIRRTGYTSASAGRHLRLGAIIQLALSHHAAPPETLLWQIDDARDLRHRRRRAPYR